MKKDKFEKHIRTLIEHTSVNQYNLQAKIKEKRAEGSDEPTIKRMEIEYKRLADAKLMLLDLQFMNERAKQAGLT